MEACQQECLQLGGLHLHTVPGLPFCWRWVQADGLVKGSEDGPCRPVLAGQGEAQVAADFPCSHSLPALRFTYPAGTGPDAIKSLKGTIKKLKAELAEVEAKGQVQRYKALQLDLAVSAELRAWIRGASR